LAYLLDKGIHVVGVAVIDQQLSKRVLTFIKLVHTIAAVDRGEDFGEVIG
jgi:hypothetical protein